MQTPLWVIAHVWRGILSDVQLFDDREAALALKASIEAKGNGLDDEVGVFEIAPNSEVGQRIEQAIG